MQVEIRESAAQCSVMAVAMGVVWLLLPSENISAQTDNPAPHECRMALGFEIPSLETIRWDEQAVKVAEAIAPLLVDYGDSFDRETRVQSQMDTLKERYGDELVRQAVIMIMAGHAHIDDTTRPVGFYYAYLGVDPKYAISVAFRSGEPLYERIWAVEALGRGVASGQYDQPGTLFAVASVVCDMAYLLRPFYGDGEFPQPFQAAAKDQWWLKRADGLFRWALANIAITRTARAKDLLSAYAQWEWQPGLRGVAEDIEEAHR